MAKRTGLGQRLFVGGYDISGDVGAIDEASQMRGVQDITGINKSAMERLLLLSNGKLSFSAFFNPEVGNTQDLLKTLPNTDTLALWLLSTTPGDAVAAIDSKRIDYKWARSSAGALSGKVDAESTAGVPLEWGVLLAPQTTHAVAAAETGINDEAQSIYGAVGYLQHFSAATATVTYRIEHSSDSTNGIDGAWTTLLTFATVPTPWTPQAQRVAVSGTVKKYVRATTVGSGTAMVFSMALRRKKVTDFDAAV